MDIGRLLFRSQTTAVGTSAVARVCRCRACCCVSTCCLKDLKSSAAEWCRAAAGRRRHERWRFRSCSSIQQARRRFRCDWSTSVTGPTGAPERSSIQVVGTRIGSIVQQYQNQSPTSGRADVLNVSRFDIESVGRNCSSVAQGDPLAAVPFSTSLVLNFVTASRHRCSALVRSPCPLTRVHS